VDYRVKKGTVGGVVGEAGIDFIVEGIIYREWECGRGARDY